MLMVMLLTDSEWHWQSIDDTIKHPLKPDMGFKSFVKEYDLCLTGEVKIDCRVIFC
jgi:hypothetical protein